MRRRRPTWVGGRRRFFVSRLEGILPLAKNCTYQNDRQGLARSVLVHHENATSPF